MILPGAGFGQGLDENDLRGDGDGADLVAHVGAQGLHQLLVAADAVDEDAGGVDAVAAQLVGQADDGGLGHGGVTDQAGLDLGGAEAIATDLEHVVDAADDPDIAVFIAAGGVAGEIPALLRIRAPVLIGHSVAGHRRRCATCRARAA